MAVVKTGIEVELKGFDTFIDNLRSMQSAQDGFVKNTQKVTNDLLLFDTAIKAFGESTAQSLTSTLDVAARSLQKFTKAFVGFKNIDLGETELKTKLDALSKAIVNSGASFDALNKAASNVSSEQVRLLGESVRKFVFAFESLFKLDNFNTNSLTGKLKEVEVALNSAQKEFVDLGNTAKIIATSDIEKLGDSLKRFTDSIKAIVSMKGLGDLSNNLGIMATNLAQFGTSLTALSSALNFSAKLKVLADALRDLVSGIRSVINIKDLNLLNINIHSIVGTLQQLEITLSTFGQTANLNQFSNTIATVGESFKLFAAGFRSLINIKNFDQLAIRMQDVSDSLKTLYANLSQLNSISGFYDDFALLAKAFQRLAAGTRSLVNIRDINKLPGNIKSIVNAIDTLSAADIEAVSVKLQGLAGPLRDLASAARTLTALKNAKEAGMNLRLLAKGLSDTNPVLKAFIFVAKGIGTLSFNAIKAAVPYFLQLGKAIGSIVITNLIKAFQVLFNVLIKTPISFVVNLFNNLVNTIGNVVRAIGNLISFVVRLGGIFGSNNNAINNQNNALKNVANSSQSTANELYDLINAETSASNSTDQLTTNFNQFNSEVEAFKPKSFTLFGKEVDQLHPRLINLAAALTSLNVIGGVLGRTFQTLANGFRNVGNDAISAIKNAENLQLQISTLQSRELVQTGQFDNINDAMVTAQENAKAIISNFKTLAQITPFETNDLVASFKQLQTFGFLTDDAVKLTQIISTIPGITGDALKDIATVFGQIRTSGKLSQQDLRQLTDRGIDVSGAFRKAYEEIEGGAISAAEAMEWAKEGGLSTNDAITAIAKSISQDFAGSLALSANTTEALLSSLKSLKDEALVNLFGPVIDSSKEFLANLVAIGSQPEVMNYLRSLGTLIGGYLATAINNIISVIGGLIAAWRDIPPETKAVITQFAQFAAIVVGVTFALSALQAALGVAVFAFGVLVNPVSIIVGAMVGMGVVFKNNEQTIYTWANNATTYLNNFATNIESFVNLLFTDFSAALTEVVNFGSGLIAAFVDGIIAAFNLVAKAMQQLGGIIAFWLQPGSPPKILPDIDDWGTAAANEFLGGFTVADFNLIKDFGSTVGNLLESINIEGVDTTALTNMFANALNDINTTGTVDISGIFSQIEEIAPNATTEVQNLAEQYLNILMQQKALNNATSEYSDAVDTLNSLNEASTLADEEKRIKSLTQYSRSQYLTEEQRKAALDQISKIQQGQLIRQAEAQLKKSQEELDATKSRIDLANQYKNELEDANAAIGDNASSGGSLKDKLKGAEDAAASIADQLGGLSDLSLPGFEGAGSTLGNLGDIIKGLENPLDGLMGKFETAKTNIENAVKPLLTLFDTLRANSELVTVALGALAAILAGPKLIGALRTLSVVLAPIVGTIGLPALAAGLIAAGAAVVYANTEFGRQQITKVLNDMSDAFEAFERSFTINDVYQLVGDFVKLDTSSAQAFGSTLGINLAIIKNNIDIFIATVQTFLQTAYDQILNGANPIDAIRTALDVSGFSESISNIRTSVENFMRTVYDTIIQIINGEFDFATAFNTFKDNLFNNIINAINSLGNRFNQENLFDTLRTSIVNSINSLIDSAIQLFQNEPRVISAAKLFSLQPVESGWNPFQNIDLGPISLAFRAINATIKLIIENLDQLTGDNTAKQFEVDLQAIVTVIGAIVGGFSLLIASILPELAPVSQGIYDILLGIITFVSDVIDNVQKLFSGQITFIEALQNIFSSLWTNLQRITGGIDLIASSIVDIVTNMITILEETFQIDLSGFRNAIETVRPILEFFVSAALLGGVLKLGKYLASLEGPLGAVFRVITGAGGPGLLARFGQLFSSIKALGTLLAVTFGGALISSFNNISTAVTNIWDNIVSSVVPAATGIVTKINELPDLINEKWNDLLWYLDIAKNRFVNFINSTGWAISDFLSTSIEGAVNGLIDLVGNIGTFFANIGPTMIQYGIGLVQALIQGITHTSIPVLIYRGLLKLAETFIEWLKPGSPPKLLPDIDEWGLKTAEQFILGFASAKFGDLMESIKTTITNLWDTFKTFIDNINGITWTDVFFALGQFVIDIKTKITDLVTAAGNIVENILEKTLGWSDPFAVLSGFVQSVIDLIASIKSNVDTMITDLSGISWTNPFTDFKGFIDDVITAIGIIITTAKNIASDILTESATWADPFGILQGYITNIQLLIGTIVTNVSTMLTDIQGIEWVNPFTNFTGFIDNIIELIATIFEALKQTALDLVTTNWVNPFTGLITFISDVKTKVLNIVATFLTTKAGLTLIRWLDPFTGLITFIDNVKTGIANILATAKDLALQLISDLNFNDPFTALTNYTTTIRDFVSGIFDIFSTLKDDILTIDWSDPFTGLSSFVLAIKVAIKTTLNVLRTLATDLLGVIFQDPFTTLSPFITAVQSAIENVKSTFNTLKDNITNIEWGNPFSGLMDKIQPAIDLLNDLIDKLNQIPGVNLPGFGKNAGNEQTNPNTPQNPNDFSSMLSGLNLGSSLVESGNISLRDFDNVVAKLQEAGLASGEGFLIGFNSIADKWSTDMRNQGDRAVKAVKDQLGIKSPSKVMMDEVGQPMAEGIVKGFVDNFKDAAFTTAINDNLELFKQYYTDQIDLETVYFTDKTSLRDTNFGLIYEALTTFTTNTFDITDKAYQDLIDLTDTFYSDLLQLIVDMFDDIIKEFNDSFDEIIKNTNDDLATLISSFDAFISSVLGKIDAFLENVKTKMGGLVQIFKDAIGAAISGLIEVLDTRLTSETIASINSTINSLRYEFITRTDAPWDALGDDMAGAFVHGIADGITKRIRDVIISIQRLVDEAMKAGKAAIESHSPSQLTNRELGQPFAAGIAEGIGSNSGLLADSINSLFNLNNTDYNAARNAMYKMEREMTNITSRAFTKIADGIDVFATALPSLGLGNLGPNEIFDTQPNLIAQQTNRLSESLLTGLGALMNGNNGYSDISTRNITQQASNSFVRTTNKNYNLYLSVDQNQYTDVNRNFSVMEYLGI